MIRQLLAGVACVLAATTANAVNLVTYNYVAGTHIEPFLTAGSNGAAFDVIYGDGANFGVSPQNQCIDGYSGSTPRACNDYNLNPANGVSQDGHNVTFVGGGAGTLVNGNNGLYWTNYNPPKADYFGSLTYDKDTTFSYTDQATSVTETWYAVTGGSLAWAGAYGFEVLVAPSATSGTVGGSFFSYSFANGNVNLLTGVRTSASKCDLGIAGSAVVGTLLCGVANPASSYQYSSSGTYVKPVNWSGVRENGDGTIDLLMYGNRFTAVASGNNLQERMTLSNVPVPGAVWLFGSALGLLGLRRKQS